MALYKNLQAALQLSLPNQTVTELAHKVGLSLSPCHRRVKALEETGIIKGYRAQLDISQLGLNFSTIVFVTLKNGDKDELSETLANIEKSKT